MSFFLLKFCDVQVESLGIFDTFEPILNRTLNSPNCWLVGVSFVFKMMETEDIGTG